MIKRRPLDAQKTDVANDPCYLLIAQIVDLVTGTHSVEVDRNGVVTFSGTDQQKNECQELINTHMPELITTLNTCLMVFVKRKKLYRVPLEIRKAG